MILLFIHRILFYDSLKSFELYFLDALYSVLAEFHRELRVHRVIRSYFILLYFKSVYVLGDLHAIWCIDCQQLPPLQCGITLFPTIHFASTSRRIERFRCNFRDVIVIAFDLFRSVRQPLTDEKCPELCAVSKRIGSIVLQYDHEKLLIDAFCSLR